VNITLVLTRPCTYICKAGRRPATSWATAAWTASRGHTVLNEMSGPLHRSEIRGQLIRGKISTRSLAVAMAADSTACSSTIDQLKTHA